MKGTTYVKKILLAVAACSLLALGLTGCPNDTGTAASTGNENTSTGSN